MYGYLLFDGERVPKEFNAGSSLYAAAWPLVDHYTSSANSGFITAFYILFVPVLGMVFGHKVTKSLWAAIPVCLVGFYLLSVTGDFVVSRGDWLTLIRAQSNPDWPRDHRLLSDPGGSADGAVGAADAQKRGANDRQSSMKPE